jgi:hypothetical protein
MKFNAICIRLLFEIGTSVAFKLIEFLQIISYAHLICKIFTLKQPISSGEIP